MVLMNNLKTTDDLLKKVEKSAGGAEDKFGKDFGNSLQAKVNDFNHTWEQFYQSIISSDALKVIVQTGTKLVGVLDALVNSSQLPTTLKGSGL
ncbi:phage-related protein [Clostridium botulinum B str. Osaka05]|uniref:Phage-related protein n=1 Tax=Clostridium botulinum B str. Osaka05 TaxID=1407017 RepID=A0A060N9J0_CLOBO|nr:phage-related protein [Clostridium botulinum B str. Osaka05]